MQIRLDMPSGQNVIRAYARGQVTVNQETYRGSLLVTPERIVADWPPQSFPSLEPVHFEAIVALAPEIVLIGTGARLRFPPPGGCSPRPRGHRLRGDGYGRGLPHL